MFKMKAVTWAMIAVGSLMAIGVDGGCWNLGTNGLMQSINPCGIIDCSGGLLGGAIDPCGLPGDPTDDLFVGCP